MDQGQSQEQSHEQSREQGKGGDREYVSAMLTVAAPTERVFAVLANPATHASIDGTGWVQKPVDRASLSEVGQIFRMAMYHPNHPNGDYQVANKVHVFDAPRAIGWLTGEEKEDGRLTFGGWFWRYDLVPLGPAETEVTLTYDWTEVPPSIREYLEFPMFGPDHLSNSLRHLADLAGSG
ncbi:SRPBCC family protein [Streptomyces buecherae]|uniref:polyketide cyclase n=1 Tax=Streptomyces buecherae TaxID=2763006 RepID=UPI0027DF824B|nr:polyketide cyclase [Streptomyces buecherae]